MTNIKKIIKIEKILMKNSKIKVLEARKFLKNNLKIVKKDILVQVSLRVQVNLRVQANQKVLVNLIALIVLYQIEN
jgi:hypothetical protein